MSRQTPSVSFSPNMVFMIFSAMFFSQCMTSNVCRIRRSCTMICGSQKFDGANHNITTSYHVTIQDYVQSHNTHHYIHVLSNMEVHTIMSSSSLRVHVWDMSSIHLSFWSVISSTLVARLHIAIALGHSSSLAVVSSRAAHQKKNFVISIGGSLAVVVYAHGRHFFSTLWNVVLPRWGHIWDMPYVLLFLV